MKVIIGYDSAEASGYIIEDLKTAGFPQDTHFHVVSATDMEGFAAEAGRGVKNMEHPPDHSWQEDVSPETRSYLLSMLHNAQRIAAEKERELDTEAIGAADSLKAAFPQATVTHEVVPLSPYSGIMTAAGKMEADLIVVGSQNATALTRFFLGSVSQQVVSHADVSVRIARAHAKPNINQLRIIVGFDASADAQKVLDTVAARQWPSGTVVRVVTVAEEKSLKYLVENLARLKSDNPLAADGHSAQAVKALASAACDRLKASGVSAEPVGLDGDPKKVLLSMADEWNADCIFIGAKGHQSRQGQPLGAVASVIATRAHCSVEVVRL